MLTPAPEKTWTKRAAAHLLNRAGFGGSPEQIERVFKSGRKAAITELLSEPDESERFPEPEWMSADYLAERRRGLMKARQGGEDLSREEREKRRREMQREIRSERRKLNGESIAQWISRMHSSKAQGREKMTLFWHGHFATATQKVKSPVLMHRQNALFRRKGLGSFKELTFAICEDPAMMLYLDTDKNSRGKPNENFARELLELFTLGEGNYTEKDITEAARAFTGYQLNRFSSKPRFLPRRHDAGRKEFMGEAGRFKPKDIVDIVFQKDRCAEFLVTKLWEFFVYESPEKEIVDALAADFRKSGYVVKPLLKQVFSSEAFYSEKAVRTQIKSPVQLVVQMARELELPSVPTRQAAGAMQQLGQILYNPPNVAGWEGGRSWINTSTLLARYNVAGAILKGTFGGKRAPGRMMDRRRDRRRMPARKAPDLIKLLPPGANEDDALVVNALVERFFHTDLPEADLKQFRSMQ